MNCLKRNTAKLFSNNGKLFVLAIDHAQCGVVPGLEKPRDILNNLADSQLDGYIVNIGLAGQMAQDNLVNKKLILRTSFGGSALCTEFSNVHKNHVSPKLALEYGADAVLMMMTMGKDDFKSIQDAAQAIDDYHQLGIPVIVEILSADFDNTATFNIQYNGARVAAELGADVVKLFYTEDFDKVVSSCPVPVILAGGAKGKDIKDVAKTALTQGVKGFAFGRNLFQAENPRKAIEEINNLFV